VIYVTHYQFKVASTDSCVQTQSFLVLVQELFELVVHGKPFSGRIIIFDLQIHDAPLRAKV
jgi:hypothetical protein